MRHGNVLSLRLRPMASKILADAQAVRRDWRSNRFRREFVSYRRSYPGDVLLVHREWFVGNPVSDALFSSTVGRPRRESIQLGIDADLVSRGA